MAYTRENTNLKVARAHEKIGYRPAILGTQQINCMIGMYDDQKHIITEICKEIVDHIC